MSIFIKDSAVTWPFRSIIFDHLFGQTTTSSGQNIRPTEALTSNDVAFGISIPTMQVNNGQCHSGMSRGIFLNGSLTKD